MVDFVRYACSLDTKNEMIESSEVLHRSFTPSYLSIELMKRDMIESVDKLMPLGADRYICMYLSIRQSSLLDA